MSFLEEMPAAPGYGIKLPYDPAYLPHLPPGAIEMNYTTDPETLHIPGDIELLDQPVVDAGGISFTRGKLVTAVKVRFPDGFEIEFPINSSANFIQAPGEPGKIFLNTAANNPFAALQVGGKRKSRKSRNRRRKSRRR